MKNNKLENILHTMSSGILYSIDLKKFNNIYICSINQSVDRTFDDFKKKIKQNKIEDEVKYELFNGKIYISPSMHPLNLEHFNEVLAYYKLEFIKSKQDEILSVKASLIENLKGMPRKDKKVEVINKEEVESLDFSF